VVAQEVINLYGDFYPELLRNEDAILDNLTREEERFQRTVEGGLSKLEILLKRVSENGEKELSGEQAFDLYATYGLPFEITRDIAIEHHLSVDEKGFRESMENHRSISGSVDTFGSTTSRNVEVYQKILKNLQNRGELGLDGVLYNPYKQNKVEGNILAIFSDGKPVQTSKSGDMVEILLPETNFYVEAGGQVSDTGEIYSSNGHDWKIHVQDVRKPTAGVILHIGEVVDGMPKVGDLASAQIDIQRRQDIMRNHTATHLLHSELRTVLGSHARQAGSLVAPDRLRFDFTHPQPLTNEQIKHIENGVNRNILGDYPLNIEFKPLQQAINDGAIALFGEKYDQQVRNIRIGMPEIFSNELCGGTHVEETGDIGLFLITSEGSAAAGIRRIEAVTGREAYKLVQQRFKLLQETASNLSSAIEDVPNKTKDLVEELTETRSKVKELRQSQAIIELLQHMDRAVTVNGVPVLTAIISNTDADSLRHLTDVYRQRNPTGVAVLASVSLDGKPIIIAALTDDLVKRGLHAGDLVKFVATPLGGGGGGRPTLAQAGGKDAKNLDQALDSVIGWVEEKLS
jgi:alanyl-tRNA synthetase